jgi:hypothetical protein
VGRGVVFAGGSVGGLVAAVAVVTNERAAAGTATVVGGGSGSGRVLVKASVTPGTKLGAALSRRSVAPTTVWERSLLVATSFRVCDGRHTSGERRFPFIGPFSRNRPLL